MSLLPSAAACASSPSTTSSGSGGTAPTCQGVWLSPIASTSSGARKNDRHSSPQTWVVGAGVFVAGMADQHRPRHQLAERAAAVQAKTALAHIGNRVTAMLLRKRLVAGPRAAAEVGHRNRFAFEQRGRCHGADLGMCARRRNRQQRLEQRRLRTGWRPRSRAAGILAKLTATERLAAGARSANHGASRGRSSMVERQLPKLHTRVRFPSPAPTHSRLSILRNSAYLSPPITRRVPSSQDDGAEPQSGLRADPGAVPGASTLAA